MLLIITDRKEFGKSLAQYLVAQGIFLYRSPVETGAFLLRKKDIGGAVIDFSENRRDAEKLFGFLRSEYPLMPVFGIFENEKTAKREIPFAVDHSFDLLSEKVLDFCVRDCHWPEDGRFSTYFLTVGRLPEEVIYMGYPLELSPTEHRILRCLLYRYPNETPAEDLAELCFPFERVHISNLATQIHRINEKATKRDARPLIRNLHHTGYVLRNL